MASTKRQPSPKREVTYEELVTLEGESLEINEHILARAVLDDQYPLVDREKRTIEIPSLLETQERSLYLAIATLCRIGNVKLILYESKVLCNTKKDTQKYVDGFFVGTLGATPSKLDRSKQDLELGRTTAYALKVRGEMIKLGKFDLLCKNNFYFGNNPGEKTDKFVVLFGAKLKFIDIFEDPVFGQAIYSVFLYLFEEVGLSQFDEKEFIASLSRHTLRFDEVVSRFYQPIKVTKKGKAIVTGFRKGKKPNPSPLLTKGEYNLLMKIATPMWNDLDTFKLEWANTVYSTAKSDKILDRLRSLYKSRFEFLQKFGSLTTKRLQEVRAFCNNANLKKVDVTSAMLVSTLQKRASPGEHFRREVTKLFETNKWALDEYELINNLKEGELSKFIVKEAMAVYVDDNVFVVKVEKLEEAIPLDKEVLQCLTAVKTILTRIREFSGRLARCTCIWEASLLKRRFIGAETVMKHVMKGIESLVGQYKTEIIEFILTRFFQIKTPGLEFVSFLESILAELQIVEKLSKSGWENVREDLIAFSNALSEVRKQLTLHESLYVQPK